MFRKNDKIAAKMGTNKDDLCQPSDMTCKLQMAYIHNCKTDPTNVFSNNKMLGTFNTNL